MRCLTLCHKVGKPAFFRGGHFYARMRTPIWRFRTPIGSVNAPQYLVMVLDNGTGETAFYKLFLPSHQRHYSLLKTLMIMGNNQSKLTLEIPDAMQQYIQTTFESEDAMRKHYLQLSNIMHCAHNHRCFDTEYSRLKKLYNKLKQYATFIQILGEHEWDKETADIQNALGIYLMQNDIDSRIRKQTNQKIASQLQFIVFLSRNTNLIKQIQGITTEHLSNVLYILENEKEHLQNSK